MPSAQPTVTATRKGARRLRSGIPWALPRRGRRGRGGAVKRDRDGDRINAATTSARRSGRPARAAPAHPRARAGRYGFFFASGSEPHSSAGARSSRTTTPTASSTGRRIFCRGSSSTATPTGSPFSSSPMGMEARRSEIVTVLDELLKPRLIAVRNDTAARTFEGLDAGGDARLPRGAEPLRDRPDGGPEDRQLLRSARKPPARRRVSAGAGARPLRLSRRLRALAGAPLPERRRGRALRAGCREGAAQRRAQRPGQRRGSRGERL